MLRRLMGILLALGVIFGSGLGSAQEAAAVSPDAAREFINKLGQRTLSVLQAQNISPQQRGAELGRILLDGVDFDIVSMHTLGRFGRRPDSREFQEFSLLFSAYVIDLAIEKFGTMPVQSYSIVSAQSLPNGDVTVHTTVVPGSGQTLNAGWRVRQTAAGPKIIDIVVDGYSMTTHFAGQYQDWLSKAGLEGLVSKMRGQTRNSPSLVLVKSVRGR
ncbi:MAG: ABC transporter substrate-binding protein [Alphaproteobacteria bacterium]|nr:ABC transporter substrate-binding protein [Alphaproteobacteria bacterium]